MLMESKACCCRATTTPSSLNRLWDDGCKPEPALHPHCVTRASALFRRRLTLYLSARRFHWPATQVLQETVCSPAIQSWQGIIGKWSKTDMQRVLKSLLCSLLNQPSRPPLTYKKLTKSLSKAHQQSWRFLFHSIFVFILRNGAHNTLFPPLTSSYDGSDGLRTCRLFSLFHHHTKPRLIKQVWRHGNRVRSD